MRDRGPFLLESKGRHPEMRRPRIAFLEVFVKSMLNSLLALAALAPALRADTAPVPPQSVTAKASALVEQPAAAKPAASKRPKPRLFPNWANNMSVKETILVGESRAHLLDVPMQGYFKFRVEHPMEHAFHLELTDEDYKPVPVVNSDGKALDGRSLEFANTKDHTVRVVLTVVGPNRDGLEAKAYETPYVLYVERGVFEKTEAAAPTKGDQPKADPAKADPAKAKEEAPSAKK